MLGFSGIKLLAQTWDSYPSVSQYHHNTDAVYTAKTNRGAKAVYCLLCGSCFPLDSGSPAWVRSTDQQINSLLLYQLSYWGIINKPAWCFLWQLEHNTTHFFISSFTLSSLRASISETFISFPPK